MTKRVFFIWVVVSGLLLTSCNRPSAGNEEAVVSNSSSPLGGLEGAYDQRHTEACWIYAMLACIEHEAKLSGDSVLLSRQWLLSRLMEEQTIQRFIIKTQTSNDNNGLLHTFTKSVDEHVGRLCSPLGGLRGASRGVGPDALRLISTYGLVPYQHERSRINNSRVLERKLCLLADRCAASMPSHPNDAQKQRALLELKKQLKELLPRFTISSPLHTTFTEAASFHISSPLPSTGGDGGGSSSFYYLSMRYTPLQFAESVMYRQQWQWYASSPYHPYNTMFALEVPDNRRYHQYLNLPMKEIEARVIASLEGGHAVYWEISRRRDAGASDHAMAIVGLTRDKKDRLAFLCLNSYGKKWGHNGYCTVSLSYFRHHTCNVGIIAL